MCILLTFLPIKKIDEKLCLIFLGHLGPQVNYFNWSSSVVLGCASSFVRYQIYSFNFFKKTAWLMATIYGAKYFYG